MPCTNCSNDQCPLRTLLLSKPAELFSLLASEFSVFHIIASTAAELLERNEQQETNEMALALRVQDRRLHQLIHPLMPPPGDA